MTRRERRLAELLARVPPLAKRLRQAPQGSPSLADDEATLRELQSSFALALRCVDLVLDLDVLLEKEPLPPADRAGADVLDIGRLVAQGLLSPARRTGALSLPGSSEPLPYRLTAARGEHRLKIGAPFDQDIGIAATRPTFGGVRYWLVCPTCGRRALHLYMPDGAQGFACRVCHHIDKRLSMPRLRAEHSVDLGSVPFSPPAAEEAAPFKPGPSYRARRRPRQQAGR